MQLRSGAGTRWSGFKARGVSLLLLMLGGEVVGQPADRERRFEYRVGVRR